MENSFYSENELKEFGFISVGTNVKLSKKASIYGASKIKIGNNVRIDDFCVLSGKIELGSNIHISVYSAIFAGDTGVILNDFSGMSSRCIIYAESDDYSGEHMTNATIDSKYLGIQKGAVELCRHVLLGSGTTVLPGVTIGEGTTVGCMSLVKHDLTPWGIYAGIPCRLIKTRSKKLLDLEKEFLKESDNIFV